MAAGVKDRLLHSQGMGERSDLQGIEGWPDDARVLVTHIQLHLGLGLHASTHPAAASLLPL